MNTPEATPGTVRSSLDPRLQELIHLLGVDFVEPAFVYRRTGRPFNYGCGGFWQPCEDIISVTNDSNEKSMQNFYLMHELSHWTGHPNRLNRKAIVWGMRYGQMPDAVSFDTEEATAQFGMYKLAVQLGFDAQKANRELHIYLRTLPMADLHKAEKDAQAAIDYILEKAYGYKKGLTSLNQVA